MKNQLYPIGIGTYNLDLENKMKTLDGLLYTYSKGRNYISTSLMYANCEVVNFLKNFFARIERNEMFIMSHLEKYIEKRDDVEKQVDEYLKRMKLDYIDALQIHASYVSKIPLMDTYEEMDKLVRKGKVRYLSASNTNIEELRELNNNFDLYSFEGVYNLECKIYENIGLIDYCKENNIKFVCYQALRRNRIAEKQYPFLIEMAKKYNKTQNQILLNWLVKEKGIYPLIKTTNIVNIDSNLDSLNFEMEEEDKNILNKFQNEKFNSVDIDWNDKNGGITIDKLASQLY